MNAEELEAAADELLAEDMRTDHPFDGTILLDHHLRRRREREVYSSTGMLEQFKPGIFSRPLSVSVIKKRPPKHDAHE